MVFRQRARFNGENQSLGGSGGIVSHQLYRCVSPTVALIRGGRGEIWKLHLCHCGDDWQSGWEEEEELCL